MSVFKFESPRGEIRITIIAADEDRATSELLRRILELQEVGIFIFNLHDFRLVSAY